VGFRLGGTHKEGCKTSWHPGSALAAASAMLQKYTDFWICYALIVIEPYVNKKSVYVHQQLGKLLSSTKTANN
jgi:succinate-acetate transporter protein